MGSQQLKRLSGLAHSHPFVWETGDRLVCGPSQRNYEHIATVAGYALGQSDGQIAAARNDAQTVHAQSVLVRIRAANARGADRTFCVGKDEGDHFVYLSHTRPSASRLS